MRARTWEELKESEDSEGAGRDNGKKKVALYRCKASDYRVQTTT
jgi:hypothetical protein